MFTILFTAAGRRVELIRAFQQSLKNQHISARIITADVNPGLAPACHFADQAYQAPRCDDSQYINGLLEICQKERINLLVPLYEPEFTILDQHREQFKQTGTFILLSNKIALATCKDKHSTYQFFVKEDMKTPRTWLSDQLPGQIAFPLFAKPRSGMGSAGIAKIDTMGQLEQIRKNGPRYIIQEYISGTEYTLDILSDFSGQVLSAVPRERLEVRCGEVTKSRTVKRQDLIEQGKTIVETLGAIGPVTLQCIDTGTEIYWIEINPRFGGGVPLSIRAGVDYPYILYKLCQGEKVEPFIGSFQDGLLMLRYDQAVYL